MEKGQSFQAMVLMNKWMDIHMLKGEKKKKKNPDTDLKLFSKINSGGTSLVAQWLRIRLPMQGTRV